MKTTKEKLLNLVVTLSVTINLVMLAGIGCIALIDHNVSQIDAATNSPVVVYVPKAVPISKVASLTKLSAAE